MNAPDTLRLTTYIGLIIAFLAGLTSLLWKASVEVEGTTRKKLTPAGWILLTISLLGLVTGVVSEVVRSRKAEKDAKINQQHLAELITSTQPLTSLSLSWKFFSTDPTLWGTMKAGKAEIRENADSSQGGVPRIPFEIEEYQAALLPLLSYIARLGPPSQLKPLDDESESAKKTSIAALIPLDDSQNAILSFGQIEDDIDWDRPVKVIDLSAGFLTLKSDAHPRTGSSTPTVTADLSAKRTEISSYSIEWELDPDTLANSVDRLNTAVPSTARMPKRLMVAIFYDIKALPFSKGNFAKTSAGNLWRADAHDGEKIDVTKTVRDFQLSLKVNGTELPAYKLKSFNRRELSDKYDDAIGARCTLLEFESP